MCGFTFRGFFKEVLSLGRVSFTIEEVMARSGYARKTAQVSLSRLVRKGEVVLIRRGFYTIITPEYFLQKELPPLAYIDDLMRYVGRRYYVSLLSAAALHGAAHQQSMSFFVTISAPSIRDVQSASGHIVFSVRRAWDDTWITQMKVRTGYVNVSLPATTMLDMVEAQRSFGLGRVTSVVEELAESVSKSELRRIASHYPNATVQRLGYILAEVVGARELSHALATVLSSRKVYPQYLSLSAERCGALDEKWGVVVNDGVEVDML